MGVLTFISWERHIWTKLLNNSWLTKQLAIEETKWRLRMWKLRSCRTVSSLQPNFLKDTGLVRNHCNMQTILGKGCSSPALLSSPKAEAASPWWTFPLKIPTALLVYTVFLNTAFKGWRGVPLAAKRKSEQLSEHSNYPHFAHTLMVRTMGELSNLDLEKSEFRPVILTDLKITTCVFIKSKWLSAPLDYWY